MGERVIKVEAHVSEKQMDAAIMEARRQRVPLLIVDQEAIDKRVSQIRVEKAVFTNALRLWKTKETESDGHREMDKVIDSAKLRGVALVLEIPRSVLGETAKRPAISEEAVVKFARDPKADPMVLDILPGGEVELIMANESGESHLLIRTKNGVCGTLSSNQVADLRSK